MTLNYKTALLTVLDGFGINPSPDHNAIAQAQAPVWNHLWKHYPHCEIQASEHFVGLPAGYMGNSEVGHLNLGAGRVVYQDFSLITKSIQDGDFFNNPALSQVFDSVKSKNSALHLIGLISDGGVHSHELHLQALLEMSKRRNLERVYIHFIGDGRDTPPQSALEYLARLNHEIKKAGRGEVVTVCGRFYAMDRDKRWDRVKLAYQAIAQGQSSSHYQAPETYIQLAYQNGISDEFLAPSCLSGYQGVRNGDGIIFYNFRADRMREIVACFIDPNFSHFETKPLGNCSVASMSLYDEKFSIPVAYEKQKIRDTLGEVISQSGFSQLRIAETEKYAHVTYFFNGGEEAPFPNEERVLIPSPKDVKTYDLKPEMSAYALTDQLLSEISKKRYELVVMNFANPDMVGHTGNLDASIKAIEAVDQCLGKIYQWVKENSALWLITADHGNCEKMVSEKGEPLTSHTTLPVPLVVVGAKETLSLKNGRLADIAPTLLKLMGLDIPKSMSGTVLV